MKTNSKQSVDAYGHEIMAFYKGGAPQEIIERDDRYIEVGSSGQDSYYLREYPRWPTYEKQAMKFAKGNVLDIGCGAGRHALYLQKKGLCVLGIDNAPLAIKVCRLRGVKKTKLLSIDGIHELGSEKFDTILMLGNNFGLFGSFNKARGLLKTMVKITRPGARIIAGTLDPHQTKNPDHLFYHRRNLGKGRMAGQVRIRVRFKNLIGPWMDYLFVSKKEMAKILKGTGWMIRKILPSKGSLYIAVIQKAH